VFQRIGYQFVDDHSARDGQIDGQLAGLQIEAEADACGRLAHPLDKTFDQFLNVRGEVDLGKVLRTIELFVNQRQRTRAIAR
jgi:hypothetical protein